MFEFRLLGTVDLRGPDGRTIQSVLAQPKRVALLAYLALAQPRGFHRRESLLGLLWPEVDQARARNSLNQAVHFLRRSLEEGILVSRGEELMVQGDRLWCDALEMERAVESGRPGEALALYGGELLPGLYVAEAPEFERWLEGQRERMHSLAVSAAETLADRAQESGDGAAALRWSQRAAELNPDSERSARRLISLLAWTGDASGALAYFESFARSQRERYGAEPSRETLDLVSAVRAGAVRTVADRPRVSPEPVIEPLAPEPESEPAVVLPPERAAPEPVLTSASDAPAPPPRRRKLGPAAAAVALLIVVLAGMLWWRNGGGRSAGNRRVLIADFQSATGDSLLARVVTEAIRIDLGQSPRVRVVEPRAVRQALSRMQRDGSSVLDLALAREVALREGIEVVAMGEVSRVGAGYLITARLLSPETDETLTALREAAVDSTSLIHTIDRLSSRLRSEMGESLRSIRRTQPLERVTTASLPALRRYSLAVNLIDVQGDYSRGIALLRDAVGLDPRFAMAYRKLGVALLNTGAERSQVLDAYEKAYQNRDRLTTRERFLVTAAYHGTSREDAIVAYQALLDIYPNDVYALNNIGYLYSQSGNYEQAALHYRRAVQADPSFAVAAGNLVGAEFNRGDVAAARSSLASYARNFPENPLTMDHAAHLESALGNYAEAERILLKLREEKAENSDWMLSTAQQLAYLSAVQGRTAEAVLWMRRVMDAALRSDARDEYLEATITLAMMEIHTLGSTPGALQRVKQALTDVPLDSLPAQDRPVVELAWFYADAGLPARSREMLEELVRSTDPRLAREINRKAVLIRAAIQMADGKPQASLGELRQAEPTECPICLLPRIGQAHQAAGATDSAVAAYERYVEVPFFERVESDAIWLPYVYRQLIELHLRAGRTDRAREYLQRLERLWSGADPELRQELVRMGREVG